MAAPARYLSIDVKREAGAEPFVRCAVPLAPAPGQRRIQGIDPRKPPRLRQALRGALAEKAPEFRYVDGDIRSVETGSGAALPLATLDDPIACLGKWFGGGEEWRIAVTIVRCVTPSPASSGARYFVDTVALGAESVMSLFTCNCSSPSTTSPGDEEKG